MAVRSYIYVFPEADLTRERHFLYSLINILRMTTCFVEITAGPGAIA